MPGQAALSKKEEYELQSKHLMVILYRNVYDRLRGLGAHVEVAVVASALAGRRSARTRPGRSPQLAWPGQLISASRRRGIF